MNQDSETLTDQREALKLKLPEPDVSSEQPWQDDVLNRKDIASRLTKLIQNQSLPFVISIHGEWGTGKTFMLKRWQQGTWRIKGSRRSTSTPGKTIFATIRS